MVWSTWARQWTLAQTTRSAKFVPDRQTDRQTDIQTDRQTDRQTDQRQTDRQTSPNGHWLTQGDLPNLCKCVLKLGFLWVCGSFAFNNWTQIVRKPTILWVCGPRARLRVAFGMALVQSDRAPNSVNCGFGGMSTQKSL